MAVICPTCGFDENPVGTEFCEACGSELGSGATENLNPPTITPPPPPSEPKPSSPPSYDPPPQQEAPEPIAPKPTPIPTPPTEPISIPKAPSFPGSSARLIAKQAGSPIPEFTLNSGNAIIGRFDPDTGPVDIDLEGFVGEDTISRNHAEIYQEAGQWKVKDLGSVNGVFIKRSGETRFSARIMMPEIVNPGDEIAIAKIRFLFQSP